MRFPIILIFLFLFLAKGAIGQRSIRLGTLAKEESDWGKALKAMNAELIETSKGKLRFALTFDRNENELIDRMRKGQFHAVSVTAIGLGQILEEMFIFQLPMLFSSYGELDHVRENLSSEFEQRFKEKNYVFLGWGDLGFTYLFSKKPIKTQTDLKRTKFWVCKDDPVAEAFASESGKEPVLSSIGDVLSMLKNGNIETVYAPPYACLALQWFTELRYMSDLALAMGIGATIMRKTQYDMLSDIEKSQLRDILNKHHSQLIETIREKNEESIGVLKKEGIEIVSIPDTEIQKWRSVALRVQNQLAAEGRFYDQELLNRARQLIEEYRKSQQKTDLSRLQRRMP